MPADNHNVILSRFNPWLRIPCWVVCNANKQPVTIHPGHYNTEPQKDYQMGWRLRWKSEPQDHITTLNTAVDVASMLPGYGVGPIIGRGNTLCCFDFDHCLDENGAIINEKVRAFISVLQTYTEISVSGTGLHCFVVSDEPETEYGFNPEYIGDGKFYSGRFIRLTGRELPGHEYTVKGMSHSEYQDYKKFLEHVTAPKTAASVPNGKFTGKRQPWDTILDSAGIIHVEIRNYAGTVRHYSDGTSRTVETAWRILCPNYKQHTGHMQRNKAVVSGGGDVAILTQFKDGQCSVTCSHNHCKDASLLKMLWSQIKENRAENAKAILKSAGVRI